MRNSDISDAIKLVTDALKEKGIIIEYLAVNAGMTSGTAYYIKANLSVEIPD